MSIKGKGDPLPVVQPRWEWPDVKQAFTLVKRPGGWSAVELLIDGSGRVEKVELTEPDMMPVAVEQFKIKAFRYWDGMRKSG